MRLRAFTGALAIEPRALCLPRSRRTTPPGAPPRARSCSSRPLATRKRSGRSCRSSAPPRSLRSREEMLRSGHTSPLNQRHHSEYLGHCSPLQAPHSPSSRRYPENSARPGCTASTVQGGYCRRVSQLREEPRPSVAGILPAGGGGGAHVTRGARVRCAPRPQPTIAWAVASCSSPAASFAPARGESGSWR